MGMDTTVFVGYYLECKTAVVPGVQGLQRCVADASHKFSNGAKHCPECGKLIMVVDTVVEEVVSLYDVNCGEPLDELFSAEEYQWLNENFTSIDGGVVGYDREGYELVVIDSCSQRLESCESGVNEFTPPARPSDELIARLKKVMQYTDIGLRYGAVVVQS